MANEKTYLIDDPNADWAELVPEISTEDPVLGGPGEIVNAPHQKLADRTNYLDRVKAEKAALTRHTDARAAHGATSAVPETGKDTIISRDTNGKAQVATPAVNDPPLTISNKKYVDDTCAAIDSNLASDLSAHVNSKAAHEATSAVPATGDKDLIIKRDAYGRAQVTAPAAANDIAILSTVTTHAALTDAHGATSAVPASGSKETIIKRDSNGRAQVTAPSAANDIAILSTVTTHANLTAAHGATSAVPASGSKATIITRDSNGKAQVATPDANDDGKTVANKEYVLGNVGAGPAGARGTVFWTTTAALANAAAVLAAFPQIQANDYILNSHATSTLSIVGVSLAPGGLVLVTGVTSSSVTVASAGTIGGQAGTNGSNGAKGAALYAVTGALANISGVSGSAIGDFFVNAGSAAVNILGVSAAIGDVVKATTASTGTAAGNIRGAAGSPGGTGPKGVALYAVTGALSNISGVSGAAIGDFFVNAGSAAVSILGVSAAIGDVVKSTSATAGTAAGNIRGAGGGPGSPGEKGAAFYSVTAALSNISGVSGAAIGDFFVNAGAEVVSILGVSAEIGDVVKSTSATVGTAAGNIRGADGGPGSPGEKGAAFYSVTAALSNISGVSGAAVGDFFVNAGAAAVSILGVSAAIGDVVKATTASTGTVVGNIRGPAGADGTNVQDASTSQKGVVMLANTSETDGQSVSNKAVAPSSLVNYSKTNHTTPAATTGAVGHVRLATASETIEGANPTVDKTSAFTSGATIGTYYRNASASSTFSILGVSTSPGDVVKATSSSAGTLVTSTNLAVTPKGLYAATADLIVKIEAL